MSPGQSSAIEERVSQVLSSTIDLYGPSLLREPQRLKARLEAACPNAHGEIAAVLAAVAAQVPHAMMAADAGDDASLALPSLVERLVKHSGLDRVRARFAVRAWARAMAVSAKGLDDASAVARARTSMDHHASIAEVLGFRGPQATHRAASDAAVATAPAPVDTVRPRPPVAVPAPREAVVAASTERLVAATDTRFVDGPTDHAAAGHREPVARTHTAIEAERRTDAEPVTARADAHEPLVAPIDAAPIDASPVVATTSHETGTPTTLDEHREPPLGEASQSSLSVEEVVSDGARPAASRAHDDATVATPTQTDEVEPTSVPPVDAAAAATDGATVAGRAHATGHPAMPDGPSVQETERLEVAEGKGVEPGMPEAELIETGVTEAKPMESGVPATERTEAAMRDAEGDNSAVRPADQVEAVVPPAAGIDAVVPQAERIETVAPQIERDEPPVPAAPPAIAPEASQADAATVATGTSARTAEPSTRRPEPAPGIGATSAPQRAPLAEEAARASRRAERGPPKSRSRMLLVAAVIVVVALAAVWAWRAKHRAVDLTAPIKPAASAAPASSLVADGAQGGAPAAAASSTNDAGTPRDGAADAASAPAASSTPSTPSSAEPSVPASAASPATTPLPRSDVAATPEAQVAEPAPTTVPVANAPAASQPVAPLNSASAAAPPTSFPTVAPTAAPGATAPTVAALTAATPAAAAPIPAPAPAPTAAAPSRGERTSPTKRASAERPAPPRSAACTRTTCGSVVAIRPAAGDARSFEMTIRMDDRSIHTLVQPLPLRPGTRVRQTNNRFTPVGAS